MNIRFPHNLIPFMQEHRVKEILTCKDVYEEFILIREILNHAPHLDKALQECVMQKAMQNDPGAQLLLAEWSSKNRRFKDEEFWLKKAALHSQYFMGKLVYAIHLFIQIDLKCLDNKKNQEKLMEGFQWVLLAIKSVDREEDRCYLKDEAEPYLTNLAILAEKYRHVKAAQTLASFYRDIR